MPEKPLKLRERQAQQTRDEILRAARHLFAERGYSRTRVRDIAEAAGVSAQTVYDSVGSKQALVAQLNDLIDVEAGVGGIAAEAAQSNDAQLVASTGSRITRTILEHCGDIVHALLTGAAAEPELAAVVDEGQRRHAAGARSTVAALQKLNALNESVDPEDAAESLAVITDFRFALVLHENYGWSLDRV